jgi:hypothetical protein
VSRDVVRAANALPKLTGTHMLGWGFYSPDAMAIAGLDLFVANSDGESVTEISTSTGALVRVVSRSSYQFDDPDAMAVAGAQLFVANAGGSCVTEISTSRHVLAHPARLQRGTPPATRKRRRQTTTSEVPPRRIVGTPSATATSLRRTPLSVINLADGSL